MPLIQSRTNIFYLNTFIFLHLSRQEQEMDSSALKELTEIDLEDIEVINKHDRENIIAEIENLYK